MNSRVLWDFFAQEGITHHETLPGTSEQNGKAERLNRTLVEHGVGALHVAKLPLSIFYDAVLNANYNRNRLPTKASAKHSLYRIICSRISNQTYLR